MDKQTILKAQQAHDDAWEEYKAAYPDHNDRKMTPERKLALAKVRTTQDHVDLVRAACIIANPAPEAAPATTGPLIGLTTAIHETFVLSRKTDVSRHDHITPEMLNQSVAHMLNLYYAGTLADNMHLTHGTLGYMVAALLEEHECPGQSYYATGWVYEHLIPELTKQGVGDVTVSPFNNCREWGLTYTVLTPQLDTRTFSIYEHRNTDSVIINGMINWSPTEHPYGPYASEHKNDFFAEFAHGDHAAAARTLAFFLKEAQKGELPNDRILLESCEHLDWTAILSERIPCFGEWLMEQGIVPTRNPEDPRYGS